MIASGNPSAGNPSPGTAAIVGVFAAVCPPVTCLTYLGLVALAEMVALRFPSLEYREVLWFVLLYGMTLGYFFLVWPAVFAGYLIGRLQVKQGPVRWWVALTFGVVTGAIVQLVLGGGLYSRRDSASYVPGQELIPTAAFAIAIMVGWGIIRNWYVAPPAAGAPR